MDEKVGKLDNREEAEFKIALAKYYQTFPEAITRPQLWRDNIGEIHMSHFAYACKMRYPLNLVLENIEYL